MNKTLLAAAIATLALAACNKPAATPSQTIVPDNTAPAAPAASTPDSTAPPAAQAAATPEQAAPVATAGGMPAFVDKVWEVRASSAVALGTHYTFLSDGTLVIESQDNPQIGRAHV